MYNLLILIATYLSFGCALAAVNMLRNLISYIRSERESENAERFAKKAQSGRTILRNRAQIWHTYGKEK